MDIGKKAAIVVIGGDVQGGAYVLRILLRREAQLRFGRFKGGKSVALPAGEYAYVGSALAARGPASLAPRLIRHATRSGKRRPHAIREEMVRHFHSIGLGPAELRSGGGKRKYWNVDYLLDLEAAELIGVVVIRTSERLEGALAGLLERDPRAQVVEKGLGAGDAPGSTHLLRIASGDRWWAALAARLRTGRIYT